MSSTVPITLNPATTSGTQLAALLIDVFLAMLSGLSGNVRPVNAQNGCIWVDTNSDSATLWYVKLWDGTSDITICGIDRVTAGIVLPASSGLLRAVQSSDNAAGPKVQLFKKRIAGSGQTQSADSEGSVEYRGYTATAVEVIVAAIEALATQNITDTAQGTDLIFRASTLGAAAATEVMRLKDAKLGIGTITPSERLHLIGNARLEYVANDTVAPILKTKKARIAGSGQVLSADGVGQWSLYSTDNTGAEIEVARIISNATENHTTTAQGTSLKIFTKANGSTTLVETLTLTNGTLTTLPAGYYKNNLTAVVAPTVSNDNTQGYAIGSFWVDHTTDFLYYAKSVGTGTALWELLGGGGGFTAYATESVTTTITTNTTRSMQLRRVQGNAGPQTLNVTPFGTGGGWKDTTIVRIMGKHATNKVTIPYDDVTNDVAKGAILNGEVVLALNDFIELQYLSTEDRWFEISRNIKTF